MRLLSVTLFTLATLFASVRADYWYAIFNNASGYSFLDSNNAVIQDVPDTSVANVAAHNDKGKRFKFEEVTSFVASQAHSNHWIGFDVSKQQFKADFAKDHYDALVKIEINGNMASLCQGSNCIGPGGSPTSDKYQWQMEKIPSA